MDTKKHYNIMISGRVQGVGFRWSAAAEARKLGITGFVKNLSGGNVYIEAEGYPGQLDPFVDWCRKGPPFGFVEAVDIESVPTVNFSEFIIQH